MDYVYDVNFRNYTYFGFWKINTRNTFKKKLYAIYRFISITSLTIFTFLQTIDLYVILNDIEKFNYNLCGTSTSIFTVSKTYILLFNMTRIENLREKFKNNLSANGIGKSEEDLKILKDSEKRFAKVIATFYGLVVPTVFVWTVTPILESTDKEKVFPLRIWLPVDANESPTFQIVYGYQAITLWFFVVNVLSIDLIIYGFVEQTCAQYKILEKNVRIAGEMFDRDDLKEKNRKLAERLKECVRHHQAILREVKEVEDIFNTGILIHMAGCTVLICVLGFDIIVNSPELNAQMFRQTGYVGSALFDVFFFCYYGTQLAESSLDLCKTGYSTPWYKMNLSSQKTLKILMEKAQKPSKVTAGKLFPINLPNYLNLLKISYNMLAVLRQTSNH